MLITAQTMPLIKLITPTIPDKIKLKTILTAIPLMPLQQSLSGPIA